MNYAIRAVFILILLLGYGCGPNVRPTAQPKEPTAVPTALPLPTATPGARRTLAPCPAGSLVFSSPAQGFYVCYRAGWTIWAREDPDTKMRWVQFIAPGQGGSAREELRFIAVNSSAVPPNTSEGDFLHQMDKAYRDEYGSTFLEPPQVIELDGRRALQVHYKALVPLGRAVITLVKWDTLFLAAGRQWTIEAVAPIEFADELSQAHAEFLTLFHILAQ